MTSAGRNSLLPSRSDQLALFERSSTACAAGRANAMPAIATSAEHQHAVADVAEQIAEPEADREQAPEGRVAPALGVGRVARAADREGGEHRAGEHIEPVRSIIAAPSAAGGRAAAAARRGSGRRRSRSGSPTSTAGTASAGYRSSPATLDQQDRGDRDEDVLAEEQADIVGRGRHGLDPLVGRSSSSPCCFSAAASGHRRDQRAHRLRRARRPMSARAPPIIWRKSEIERSAAAPPSPRASSRSASARAAAGHSARAARSPAGRSR